MYLLIMSQDPDPQSEGKPRDPLPGEDIAALIVRLGGDPGADLGRNMGVEILELSADRVVGRMPVKGNTQPFGLLHGGASCVLAETLGSMGAILYAGPGRMAVGIEINATHHRSASEGFVTGVATRVHGGRSLATYEVVLTDGQQRRICTARLTCMLRDGGYPSA